jgi:hypothetical protein
MGLMIGIWYVRVIYSTVLWNPGVEQEEENMMYRVGWTYNFGDVWIAEARNLLRGEGRGMGWRRCRWSNGEGSVIG